ncbi:MAG: hypothetical protein K0Q82_605 [Chryseobacterium indoltheticum]|jgi:hypothetical protein|uniref:Uncharacterized protein n=1 Tax=Chryseobacterium indoltheticum TaxID=254 RepID=A0A381FQU1_9FLAO|nr:hypothetical protein [Chryseobacterium indoltheticum]SUX48512.1 Uncharacterised protein [Chryseobacterium indoltheticum]
MINSFGCYGFKNEMVGNEKDRNFFWPFVVFDEPCQGYFYSEY